MYKFIVCTWKKGQAIGDEVWFATETEAFDYYNRCDAVKAEVIDGVTGEIISDFGFDDEDDEF